MPAGKHSLVAQNGPGSPAAPRVLRRTLLRKGAKFDVELVSTTGTSGAAVEREVLRHPGSVVILPVRRLPDGSCRIVFIRNFRLSLGRAILELPAGTWREGEDPRACAARELEEETGFRAGTLAALTEFFTAPGLTDERMHAFIATDLVRTAQRLEDDEDIEVLELPPADVFERMSAGDLDDAKSMLVLLWASSTGRLAE